MTRRVIGSLRAAHLLVLAATLVGGVVAISRAHHDPRPWPTVTLPPGLTAPGLTDPGLTPPAPLPGETTSPGATTVRRRATYPVVVRFTGPAGAQVQLTHADGTRTARLPVSIISQVAAQGTLVARVSGGSGQLRCRVSVDGVVLRVAGDDGSLDCGGPMQSLLVGALSPEPR